MRAAPLAGILLLAASSSVEAQLATDGNASPMSAPEERMHLSVLFGMSFPGQMTPRRVSTTHVGVGPALRFEGGLRLVPHFELGAYLSFSHHPIKSIDNVDFEVSGRVLLLSLGLAPKVRFSIRDWGVLRVGAILGLNVTSNELALGDRYPGLGMNFGPTVDLRVALRGRLGFIGQFGWVSQVVGHTTLPDSVSGERSQAYAFPPLVFLVAGVDVSY